MPRKCLNCRETFTDDANARFCEECRAPTQDEISSRKAEVRIKWRDRLFRTYNKQWDESDFRWCGSCRKKVRMPCVACRAKEYRKMKGK